MAGKVPGCLRKALGVEERGLEAGEVPPRKGKAEQGVRWRGGRAEHQDTLQCVPKEHGTRRRAGEGAWS